MASLWNHLGFSFWRIKLARLSAAKSRDSRRKVREERTAWQRIAQALATGWKLLATLAGVCTFLFIAVLLGQALTKKMIAIAPISVPKMLAESGYTADVAAQRLHDALNKIVEDAHTTKKGPEVAPQTDHRYTADFEAQLVHDVLNKAAENAHTKGPEVALQADLPN